MEFYNRDTSYHYFKRHGYLDNRITCQAYFHSLVTFLETLNVRPDIDGFITENWWVGDRQPYYLLWPAIIPVLTKMDLSEILCSQVEPQRSTLLLRFPKQKNPFQFPVETPDGLQTHQVHSVLVCNVTGRSQKVKTGFSLWLDIGEEFLVPLQNLLPPRMWHDRILHQSGVNLELCRQIGTPKLGVPSELTRKQLDNFILSTMSDIAIPFPVYAYANISLDDPTTSVQYQLDTLKQDESASVGIQIPPAMMADVVKLVLSVMMIDAGDTVLLEPDLLKEHEERMRRQERELSPEELAKYHAKAMQRGKYGWHLGRQYEPSLFRSSPGTPYFVPPHLQHYHVGPGRAKTILKAKKGWLANREKAEQVPSGYENLPAEGPT